MSILKRYILLIVISCTCVALLSEGAHAAWKPWWRRSKAVTPKARAKKYQYIRTHDYNHDGKVNAKDRLIWLNRKKGNYQPVLVSTENKDLIEVMDIDGDGNVESWEMQQFYKQYDLNKDGSLDDYEVDKALD